MIDTRTDPWEGFRGGNGIRRIKFRRDVEIGSARSVIGMTATVKGLGESDRGLGTGFVQCREAGGSRCNTF